MDARLDSETENVNWSELALVFEKAPLGTRDPEKLELVFRNSRYRCFLFDGLKIIGAARAMSDGFDCGIICDVVILPEYQKKNLGKKMIEYLLGCLGGHNKIILYAARGREGFYSKLGFRRMLTAMAVFSDEKKAFENGFIADF